MLDPFDTLGVPPETATLADVRAAYRAAARTHHPDRGGDEARMKALAAARDALCSEDALEDARRAAVVRNAPPVAGSRKDAARHDWRAHDGITHFGPYTRGALRLAAAQALREDRARHRARRIMALGRLDVTGARQPFVQPWIACAVAMALDAQNRFMFWFDVPLRAGPGLVVLPSVRVEDAGTASYSGAKGVVTRLCDAAGAECSMVVAVADWPEALPRPQLVFAES